MRYFNILNESKSIAATEAIIARSGKQLYARAEVDDTCPDDVVGVEEDNGKYVLQHIMDADPTEKGIYVNWIVREYLKANIARFEDLGRVYAALTRYNALKPKLNAQYKDVMRLTWGEVQGLVETHAKTDIRSENQKDRELGQELVNSGQARVVQNDSNIKIIEIHSEDAAKFFGRNTRWCTAAEHDNRFDYYYRSGPLVVVLFKKENKRCQLHFGTSQYMDEMDDPLPNEVTANLISNSPYLRKKAISSSRFSFIDSLTADEMETYLSDPQKTFDTIGANRGFEKLLGTNIKTVFRPEYSRNVSDDSKVRVVSGASALLNEFPDLTPREIGDFMSHNARMFRNIQFNHMAKIMRDAIGVNDSNKRLEYMNLVNGVLNSGSDEYFKTFHYCKFHSLNNYDDAIRIFGSNVDTAYAVADGKAITSLNRTDLTHKLVEEHHPVSLMEVISLYRTTDNRPLPAKEISRMNVVGVGEIRDTNVLHKDDVNDLAVFCPKLLNQLIGDIIAGKSGIRRVLDDHHMPITMAEASEYHPIFVLVLAFIKEYISENGISEATKLAKTIPNLRGFLRLADVEIGGGTNYPLFMLLTGTHARQLGVVSAYHVITEDQLLEYARRADAGEEPYDKLVCGISSVSVEVLRGKTAFSMQFGDIGTLLTNGSDGTGSQISRVSDEFPNSDDVDGDYPDKTSAATALIKFAKRIRQEADEN